MRATSFEGDHFQPGIQEYFSGKTVLLTGATGLVGQLVLEKLLRTCLHIERIYVLIREKKGKGVEERFGELFDNVLYDRLKDINPSYGEKVTPIKGDNAKENLAIGSIAVQKLIEEVNCVIHCSANVRFDENLRNMVYTNVRGTMELISLASKMEKLQSFVYVSTAYSNCPRKEIGEFIYEPPLSADKLLTLVDTFDDKFLQKITPSLIGKWPNTYVYSKSIAESVMVQEGRDLPVAIVRPSIVVSTYKEPLEGWVNNVYGPMGVTLAGCLGLAHTFICEMDYLTDVVPADYVANNIIAAAWRLGSQKQFKNEKAKGHIDVYNCVSSPTNPVTWCDYISNVNEYGPKISTTLMIWYPFLICVSSPTLFLILDFFLHLVPAHIGDFIATCTGKKPMFVKTYKKLNKIQDVLVYFSTNQWKFFNDNTLKLWNSLTKKDKEIYPFDMTLVDWKELAIAGLKGGRIYLIKDPIETIPEGKRKYRLLQILHYGLMAFLLFCLSMFLFLTFRLFT